MSVQEAYAEVGRITRREAKNFAYGIMVLPKAKRQAIAAIYAFARSVDDVADGELPPEQKRVKLEELRAALDSDPADPVFVALLDARERFGIPREPLAALVDGGLQDLEQSTYADFDDLRGYCEKVAGAVGLACVPVYGSDDTERAMTLGIALQLINIIRDVDEDRRARSRLSAAGRDRRVRGREARAVAGVPRVDGLSGRAGADVSRRGIAPARLARPPQRSLRRHVRRPVSRDARADRGVRLRRVRREDAPLDAAEARGRGAGAPAVKVAVVGGGLAGLAAALDLVDAGHAVTVLEARPTLGGAVQTLPEREGDPEPPPDNGQHIGLGCFTEYLSFLERIGEGGSFLRTRLGLPVIDEDGASATIEPSLPALLRYSHLPLRDRVRLPLTTLRLRSAQSQPNETFGHLLRRLGETDKSIDCFWDVFVRPALNLRCDEVDADAGLFTVRTALLGPRANSDLILPTQPLGRMHGDAAGSALEAAGATIQTDMRVGSLDELDADAIVVAVPPAESARLLGEPDPELEDSPIVSVHLWFERQLLEQPLAALLASDAHWVFDRGALTGSRPERGQYLTVVSSGVPELLEVRGRELVERIAGQLTERLGEAELLWSRVSREPYATIALRPGVHRPGVETSRPNVARAGSWTDTGWPATMESAIRSGRRAAQHILSTVSATITA